MTELALETPLSPEQRDYLVTARASAESLLGLLNDILDFSKIEAGRLELEVTDFELDLLVEETAELMAQPAQAKGIELVTRVPASIPRLLGDPSRLRQVLLNLLSNAVKFTDEGEVVVRAELARLDEDVAHVRFSVTDTGIGVSEENRERVFGSFAQADASTTRRYGGTGLGLAICRRLVDAMGGDLTLESRLGEGSTFAFNLALPLSPETDTEELDDSVLARSRLLVVDDNDTNRVVLSELLTAWGARHDAVEGGPQALSALDAAQRAGDAYTLVLLDMFMPGMDGMELARRIRAEVSSQVRMVLLTSAADLSAEEAKRAGIAVTLPKPVRAQWLRRTLVRLLTSDSTPAWTGPPRVVSLAPPRSKPGPASRGRVLVAEDNGVNQMVAVGILEKLGFRTDVAANGHEVLSAMERRSDYVAILMDCQMAEMDGFEATLALREREGTQRRTPVIAMTAAAMDEDRDLALAAGMDDFITKPVTTADLESSLSRWALAPPAEDATDGGSGAGEASSPIDSARLAELRVLGGPDGVLMKRLFAKFGARGEDLVVTMQRAVAQEDAVVARAAAHELAGAAANVGAAAVARQCAEVGKALRAGDFASADAALLVLEDALREATEHLADLTGRG
jgi:CheY-like chemotaxis protein